MTPEAEAVEIRGSAQDTAEAALTDKVGQRVGWIGDDEHDRAGCSLGDLGKDLVIDFCVGVEQLEPARRIIAIRCAASLLVHSGGDHDEGRTGQVRVLSVMKIEGSA